MRRLRKYSKLGFILFFSFVLILEFNKKRPESPTENDVKIKEFVEKIVAAVHTEEFNSLKYRVNHKTKNSFYHGILPACKPSNKSHTEYGIEKNFSVHGQRKNKVVRYSHGRYIFVQNYATALLKFECNESITFTTHGEFHFIDNVVPVVERWEGPVIVAIYAPGSDFLQAVNRIHFLRECSSPLVKKLVTFHLFYDKAFKSVTKIPHPSVLNSTIDDCSTVPAFRGKVPLFRRKNNLTYPVNVARNLARTTARTHFVFGADIELYPSLHIIPMFFQFMKRQAVRKLPLGPRPEVFVIPAFEVVKDVGMSLPNTKKELLSLLKANKSISFHQSVCYYCHRLPNYAKWLKSGLSSPKRIKVFLEARRVDYYWEPVFIGTNNDPLWDERLTWEGQRNKMTQPFTMCLLDYNFKILDNAFLVHRPGMRNESGNTKYTWQIALQNVRIMGIRKELIFKYGNRSNCRI